MSKERIQGMDTRQLQDILNHEVETLTKLRDNLSPDGMPLDLIEKKQVRNVLAGNWLDDMNGEVEHFFRKGLFKDFDHNRKYVTRVLEDLS